MTTTDTARKNLIAAGERLASAQSALFWMNGAGYVSNATRAEITASYESAKAEVESCSKVFELTLKASRAA